MMRALTGKLRRAARYAWYTTLVLVGFGALIGSLGSRWWLTGILLQFALQFCWIAGLLTLAAMLRRRWRSAAVAAALALWQLWIVWPSPLSNAIAADRVPAVGSDVAATLRVVSFNTWYRNTRYEAMIRYLRSSDADIIGLVEVTPGLKAALGALRDVYPYQVDCLDSVPQCENMLLSRQPLKNVAATRLEDRRPVVLSAEIDLPGGPVDLFVTHVSSPLIGLVPEEYPPENRSGDGRRPTVTLADILAGTSPQMEQADRLARYLATRGPDAILMGDFNSAPWSPVMRDLRQAGNWNPDRNLAPSWPRWLSAPLRLPIDHILARGRLRVTAFDTGPALTSDHLPVAADIVLRQ